MSNQDAQAATDARLQHTLMIARYGSPRSAFGSTLFSWVNLSVLLACGWPALVVVFDAPVVSVENTPLDWFWLRIGVAVAGALLTFMLWKLSPAPATTASAQAVAGMFRKSMLWSQLVLILTGVSLLLSVLLLTADASPAARVVAFGLAEAIAIQALLSGYMKSAFDVLLPGRRAFLYVLGLFGAFFALRSFAFAVIAVDGGESEVLALLAGGLIGVVVGALSLLLRDRSASILPGILLHWTTLYLIVPYLD